MSTVSVVIPLYNKAPYIERAIEAIANQTLRPAKIIVVDDGSTDDSAAIVAGMNAEGVELVRQRNQGPGAARNRGLELVHTPYVAFLDADDSWDDAYLSTLVDILERENVAAVTSSYIKQPQTEDMTPMWRKRGLKEGRQSVDPRTAANQLVSMLAFMSPCSTVSRTDVIREHGGFYAKDRCVYAEDATLWYCVLLNNPVYFLLQPLAIFHTEASALSGNLATVRPIEPFLEHPELLAKHTPPHLEELTKAFLALRAEKTACVLGAHGHGRRGIALLRQFCSWKNVKDPLFLAAMIATSPVGARLWNVLARRRRG